MAKSPRKSVKKQTTNPLKNGKESKTRAKTVQVSRKTAKKTSKKVVRKPNQAKEVTIIIKHKRGSNQVVFRLPDVSPERQAMHIERLRSPHLYYMLTRNKPNKGSGYKPPFGLMVFIEVHKPRQQGNFVTQVKYIDRQQIIDYKVTVNWLAGVVRWYYEHFNEMIQDKQLKKSGNPSKPWKITSLILNIFYNPTVK